MTSDPPSQNWPTATSTRPRLAVFYPEFGSTASRDSAVEALRRFESVIVENALLLFLNDSDYRWELSEETGGSIHARLVQTRHNLEMTSHPMEFLCRCTLEEFHEVLRKL